MHPYLSTCITEERRIDMVRSAERARVLREADIPTAIESIRLTVGRSVVQLGKLIAGRRLWSPTPSGEPLPGVPALSSPHRNISCNRTSRHNQSHRSHAAQGPKSPAPRVCSP